MKVLLYKAPNGEVEVVDIKNVLPEDEAWFQAHNITISMEELAPIGIIVYGDTGQEDEEGFPQELVLFANGRSCEEALHELRCELQCTYFTEEE